MKTPGTPSPFWPSANIQATRTISAGFMNSDGCRVKPAMLIQRVAPLASCPRNGSAAIISPIASYSTARR